MSDKIKNIVVLGGGLAGCVLSYILKHENYKVTLVEMEDEVGGLCRTKEFGGIHYEFGPHVLYGKYGSKEKKFFQKFLTVKKCRFFPQLSIDGKLGNLCDFPVTAANALKIPEEDLKQAIEELYEINLDKPSYENFREHVISRVGKMMYKYFFENYNKKQWGIDPAHMDAEWAKFRNLSLQKKGLGMFGNKWQGHPLSYHDLFAKLTHGIKLKKARVLNTSRHKKHIDHIMTDSGDVKGDFYISTIPIEHLFGGSGLLPYRGVVKCFYLLNSPHAMKSYVTTFPNNYSFTRIVDYRQQSQQKHRHSLISFAFPFDAFKEGALSIDKCNSDARRFIRKNLKTKILHSTYVTKRYVYPISTFHNIRLFKEFLCRLSKYDNIMSVGRLGLYSYISMDTCVKQCFKIVDSFRGWKNLNIQKRIKRYDNIRRRLA
ncbi:UDP-galactopyranose mutase [Candidatus Omnitrophota bacterium]